jgi:HNH endonuclease
MQIFKCKCHWCDKNLIRKKQGTPVKYHFCDRTCKGEHQRQAKPVTRDWLVEHYIVKGMDTTQIAAIVNRDPKSVWNWLKDFGIPTRPRGGDKTGGNGNPAHWFKKGHKLGAGRKLSDETKAKIRAAAIADGRRPYDPKVGPNGGRRGKDHPSWNGGITAERQAFYATVEWQAAARKVIKRDKSTCQRCGKKKVHGDGFAFDIHHVVSFKCAELRAVASNLVYLCEPCHYWVHGKKNVNRDFLKEMPK